MTPVLHGIYLILLSLFVLLAGNVKSGAQCLALRIPHNPSQSFVNPDSVMVDTCSVGRPWYAKGTFEVRLSQSPISNGATADELDWYVIQDIDTNSADIARWEQLDSVFGGLHIRKAFLDSTDPAGYAVRTYLLKFDNYVLIDSVVASLKLLSAIEDARYLNRSAKLLSIPSDAGMKPLKSQSDLATPGSFISGTLNKRYFLQGWQHGLYQLHLPMAWEIAKGSSSVYVGVDDKFTNDFSGTHQQHQDLMLTTSTPSGNYFYPGSVHQGSGVISPLKDDGHGYQNLVIAAGQENSIGLVGVAPGIRVFGTAKSTSYSTIDISNSAGFQFPHVMTCAYTGGENNQNDVYHTAIRNGIVVVGTIDNELQETNVWYDESGNPTVYEPHLEGGENVYEYMQYPLLSSPGQNVYHEIVDPPTSPADPAKDVKVLCVTGYDDGALISLDNCDVGFRGGPTIDNQYNFSLGFDKYSTNSNKSLRMAAKRKAAIDVVVPNNMIGAYYESGSTYREQVGGNSRCVPQLGGVIGLMMSVKDRIGATGRDVQKLVYDIVTFTADRIVDPGINHTVAQTMNYSTYPQYSTLVGTDKRVYKVPNQYFVDQMPELLTSDHTKLKTDYVALANDPLNRYWALRVGFGRVNAFRCLAHSIPDVNTSNLPNVKYQYAGADQLDWDNGHSLNGKTLLHLGSFKNATTKVLVGGGLKYTGEPDYMNNNGKTLIDKDLTVGNNQVLVIDGILTTSLTSGFKKIVTTPSTNAKILITGWTENVDLEGNVLASDVRFNRTSAGNATLTTTGSSEFHDNVWVRGNGDIVVSEGVLTLQSGAIVRLYDGVRIVVKAGAELRLKHGAQIIDMSSTYLSNRIVVEAKTSTKVGGKIVVEPKAEEVVVDAEVQFNDDAEFVINDAEDEQVSSVSIYKVTIEAGGKLSMADRANVKGVSHSSATPGFVLKSASGLVVANSTSVRLDVPVEVQSGSRIEVGTSATLKVGALTVQCNAKLEAGAGSTVQFLDEINTIHGICIAEGNSTSKAKFMAINETNSSCGALAHTKFAKLFIEPNKWIYNTDSPGSTALDQVLTCYFHAQDAEFTNVYTTINSAPILWRNGTNLQPGKIKNCDFRADRRVYEAAGMTVAFRNANLTLLNCDYSRGKLSKLRAASTGVPLSLLVASYKLTGSLELESCDFHDLGGKIASDDYRKLTQKNDDYPVNGFYSNILAQVTVNNCRLAFLHYGVSSRYGQCNVSNSVFGGHADAIHCRNAQVCANTISGSVNCVNIEAGSVGLKENTLGGTMNSSVNPLFGSSESVEYIGSGLLLDVGATSECRNNSLAKFGTGFHALSGTIFASDRFAFLAPTQNERGKVEVSGRNEFQSMSGSFPYLKAGEKSHVFVSKGSVRLECGKNIFSMPTETSRYQLFKLTPDTISVKVNENTFDKSTSFPTIKRNSDFLVSDESSYVDEGERLSGATCEYYLRTPEELDCTQLPVADPNAFSATYVLGDIDPLNVETFSIVVPSWDSIDSNYAKEIFIVSKYWLSDHSQSVGVRLNAVDFAVKSTTVHPKSDSVSMVLIDTLQRIVRDTTQDVSLRGKALTGCVELLSNLELFNVGKVWFDSVRTGLFHDYDSVSIENLSAWLGVMADTTLTLGDRTDTLNALTNASVELAKRPDGLGKIRSPQMSNGIEQWDFTLQPNPAGEHCRVLFQGDKMNTLQIRLVDMYGVALMHSSHRSVANGDLIEIDLSRVRNGMYLVDLSDRLHHMSRIICVVH